MRGGTFEKLAYTQELWRLIGRLKMQRIGLNALGSNVEGRGRDRGRQSGEIDDRGVNSMPGARRKVNPRLAGQDNEAKQTSKRANVISSR
jgi:hypothetical protein